MRGAPDTPLSGVTPQNPKHGEVFGGSPAEFIGGEIGSWRQFGGAGGQ